MKVITKDNKGLTLVELLVVIAIIGILAVVAIPALFKNIEKSKVTDLEADYSAFRSASLSYYAETGDLPIHNVTGNANNTTLEGYIDNVNRGSEIGGEYMVYPNAEYFHEVDNEYKNWLEDRKGSVVKLDGTYETNSEKMLSEYGDLFFIVYASGDAKEINISQEGLSKLVKDLGEGNIYMSSNGCELSIKIK